MRVSLCLDPGRSWPHVVALAQRADLAGWHAVYVCDHLMSNDPAGRPLSGPMMECWMILAALAERTATVALGSLVLGNTYRHPAVVADMAATLDQISRGRLVLGIGTGWQPNEHAAYGIPLPALRDRIAALDEACAVIRSRLNQYPSADGRTTCPRAPASSSSATMRTSRSSTSEDEWRGVTPRPRLSTLVLTEFGVGVVGQALRDLARAMLLTRCLDWIRAEEWIDLGRLRTQTLFVELAQPFIKAELLSRDSLFSSNNHPHPSESQSSSRLALEEAFRVLAPYRIFTQSHLRHYAETDPSFADALRQANWSVVDLWQAISGTALLKRPLDEPWQELSGAIRRLLYRYYFPSDERRAEAHREASEFVRVWTDQQSGRERVIGLVEALWHEAVMLRLSQPARLEEQLTESTRKLVDSLLDSAAYSAAELRAYAAERMRDDAELQAAIWDDGLLDTDEGSAGPRSLNTAAVRGQRSRHPGR